MQVKGIQLAWISVSNLQEAIKFYTDVIGLKISDYHAEAGWAELAGPEGTLLGLAQARPSAEIKAGSNAVVTIEVDDIEKARQHYLKQNVKLVGDVMEVPGHVKLQTFCDVDGNTFQLCQML